MTARPGRKDESRLRRWRVEQGYSLQEVGDTVGLHPTMLSLVERGQRQLSPRSRILFARRLGVRVQDLFEVEQLPDPIDGVLTVPEVARILRVTPRQISRLVQAGDLYAAEIGRSVRIPRAALERYLDGEMAPTRGRLRAERHTVTSDARPGKPPAAGSARSQGEPGSHR